MDATIRPGLGSGNVEEQRTTVQLVAAVARHSPQKVDSVIGVVTPGVLEAAAREDDELREYALQVGLLGFAVGVRADFVLVLLQALEVFILRCPTEVTPFLPQIIQVGVKYIKYDPVRCPNLQVYFRD